jgi:hypothetical protein
MLNKVFGGADHPQWKQAPEMVIDVFGGADHPQWKQAPEMVIDPARQYTATIETTEGTVTAQLLPGEAPKTVNNFVFLAANTPVRASRSGEPSQPVEPPRIESVTIEES